MGIRSAVLHRPTREREPTGTKSPIRRLARIVLSAIGWFALLTVAVYTAFGLYWVALTYVLLRSGAHTETNVTLVVVGCVVTTGVLAWLVARFAASRRAVGVALAIVVVAGLIGGPTFAQVFPDRALFLARSMGWGESDIKDYQRFPERAIANAPPVFNFEKNLSPELFETIEYRSGGVAKTADFDAFLDETKTTSFIVIKDDAIVYERYFNGYHRDSVVTSFSMAKSVTSALIGIAIDEGLIRSVDDPIVTYLPELRDRGLDGVTVRHVLMMSSGIRYVADDEASPIAQLTGFTDDSLSYYYPNLRARLRGVQPDGTEPGAYFNYNNHLTELLGLILERVTGMSPSAYLQEKIWEPLGMEYPASWSLDSEEHGFELMAAGLNARAIDFAKFGWLFLNDGEWDGKQIVSRSWVVESTSPDPDDDRPWLSDEDWDTDGRYYKYQWWGMPRDDGAYDFVAQGHLGQRIFVSPRRDVVIVRFGYTDEGVDDWAGVLAGVAEKL